MRVTPAVTSPPATLRLCVLAVAFAIAASAQQSTPSPEDSQQLIKTLVDRLAAAEARIEQLERRQVTGFPTPQPTTQAPLTETFVPTAPASVATGAGADHDTVAEPDEDPHAHMMEIPGGPSIKIRGFFDFNYGIGPAANPLMFPLGVPAHNNFQAGEFDLFLSSKLSDHLSFLSEIVFGSDPTNAMSIDIERYQLIYRQNKYFQISAGRFHSAIGYYNTAYHHGTWFGTAQGRPFMYYYEDTGGLLPVHNVGITAEGLVPGTGRLNLNWIAEVGNGRSSSNTTEPVQNFVSDRNHKSYNFAFSVKPEWAHGLQAGGSYYGDLLAPPAIRPVRQTVASAYVVFLSPTWEFLNEAVLLTNRQDGTETRFRTPLMYTQVARAFGKYKPYFRYQYVNSPKADPVNIYTDRYQGPSVGLRWDFNDFAAFKIQYNRVDQRAAGSNSFNSQIGFTF